MRKFKLNDKVDSGNFRELGTLEMRFLLFVILFLSLPATVRADTVEFLDLLSAQDSHVEKSVVCFRYWHNASAAFELVLKHEIRNDGANVQKNANSLFQTYARVWFLLKVSEKEGLNDLLNAGYDAGTGMKHKDAYFFIKKDCVDGVNALMKTSEYSDLSDKAYEAARVFTDAVLEEGE